MSNNTVKPAADIQPPATNDQQEQQQGAALNLCGFRQHEQQAEQQRRRREDVEQNHQQATCKKYRLPVMGRCGNLSAVTAKSVTRVSVRKVTKAYTRTSRFFCTCIQHTRAFMAGLLGASKDAPVSFVAGYANPDNPATISEVSVSHGGSKNKGAYPMAIVCRLALLTGNSPRLCSRRVRGYISLTFTSHQQARKEASRLNAAVCAWYPAGRAQA